VDGSVNGGTWDVIWIVIRSKEGNRGKKEVGCWRVQNESDGAASDEVKPRRSITRNMCSRSTCSHFTHSHATVAATCLLYNVQP